MKDARKLLAERVNELCKEKKLTYEELSSKSEVPIETVLQMAYGSVKDFFDTEEFRNIMI